MKTIYGLVLILFLSLLGKDTRAQDFVFSFVNPAFGGNPYNYSWLMDSATKQNKYDDDEGEGDDEFADSDPLKNFQEDFNYAILNDLSRKISEDVLQIDQTLSPGNYEVGTYNIRITKKSGGVNITITDQRTGGSTNMLIPNTSQSNTN